MNKLIEQDRIHFNIDKFGIMNVPVWMIFTETELPTCTMYMKEINKREK